MIFYRKYLISMKDTLALIIMMGLASNLKSAQGGVTFREITVIYLHKTATMVNTLDGLIDGKK